MSTATEKPKQQYVFVRLQVSNFKRIRTVEIHPTGPVVGIGGRNDQGKSSTLDAIAELLGGAKFGCDVPIRDGADEGKIVGDLSSIGLPDMKVTKTFKRNQSPKLKIEMGEEGTPLSSPQQILDKLCNAAPIFDPLAITRMAPDKLTETLRKLVGLDFTESYAAEKADYDARTIVNRDIEREKARRSTMKTHPDAPAEKVSVADLMAKQKVVRDHNAANEQVRAEHRNNEALVAQAKLKLIGADKEIADLKGKLKAAMDNQARMSSAFSEMQSGMAESKAVVDALLDQDEAPINAAMEAADATNEKVRDNQARAEATKKIAALEAQANKHTAAIDSCVAAREKLLAEAKFPLEGLSFDSSGVLLDRMPFAQAGTAKKILAGLHIAMAMNPGIRVILIRDASLLDEDSEKLVADFAQKHKLQVWQEWIGDKAGAVIIEDGGVKEN
jgi:AAA domain